MGERLYTIALIAATALATALVSLAIWRLAELARGVGIITDVAWVEMPSGPALVAFTARAEPADIGISHTSYHWLQLDPHTGVTVDQHQYAFVEDQIPRWEPQHTTADGLLLVETLDGWSLRDLTTRTTSDQSALEARWPQIAAPWHQAKVTAPGELHIEADDRQWWRLTLATGALSPAAHPGGLRDIGACVSQDHPLPGGYVWTWLVLPPPRHSDPNTTALVRARPLGTRDGLPTYDDITPLGLRLPHARFLCDERTGVAALSRSGDLLTQTLTGSAPLMIELSLLRSDGSAFRSRTPSGLSREEVDGIEAFGFDGGFIVRLGSVLLSLGEDGRLRWRRSL